MASRCPQSLSTVARTRPVLRSKPGLARTLASSSRCMATAVPEASSSTPAPPPPSSPKLNQLVDDISSLTLLQAADLVSLLKTRLNIQEIAMPAAAAAAPAAAAEEAPVEEKPKEKTIFSVKLESFNPAAKAKVIKEIKALVPNLTLLEAKKYVESLPQVIKENLPKEEAEKLRKTFEDVGAVAKLE
ncbi:ClpS-like protein [Heliocybe sulcata]|uniref:ClpS-like protein n=1 Tax=Heliocybe sulcata TaxID=5364 RepID=A0A5C3NE30_9AGAM|nr:ClpS-like protein [Heliocybe sulcata]